MFEENFHPKKEKTGTAFEVFSGHVAAFRSRRVRSASASSLEQRIQINTWV
jgi:hypothetical protein